MIISDYVCTYRFSAIYDRKERQLEEDLKRVHGLKREHRSDLRGQNVLHARRRVSLMKTHHVPVEDNEARRRRLNAVIAGRQKKATVTKLADKNLEWVCPAILPTRSRPLVNYPSSHESRCNVTTRPAANGERSLHTLTLVHCPQHFSAR